jgi:hypothetical protein
MLNIIEKNKGIIEPFYLSLFKGRQNHSIIPTFNYSIIPK